MPRIPCPWAQQLTVGGKLLADVKFSTGAGNLVLLHRRHNRLEGRFARRWAAFMGMRHNGDTTTSRASKAETSYQRVTTTPAQPWNTHAWLTRIFARRSMLADVHLGYGVQVDTLSMPYLSVGSA